MRTGLSIAGSIAVLLFSQFASGGTEIDSGRLKELFDADQAIRSEENRKAGKVPTVQEERDRRFEVFQLLSAGQLRTANDYFHAGMILHHTSHHRFG